MVEQVVTTAEQSSGITLEQRFFISGATFEMSREKLLSMVQADMQSNEKKPSAEAKKALDDLKDLAGYCHGLFEEMVKAHGEDGKLMFRYAKAGLRLGQHRSDCYAAGVNQAFQIQAQQAAQAEKGEPLNPKGPVDVEKMAGGAWLWPGARNASAALVDELKNLEMEVVDRGYETISIEDFDNTARGPLPTLIYTKLFRKRPDGQPAIKHALNLRNQHSALKTIVGKKSKALR